MKVQTQIEDIICLKNKRNRLDILSQWMNCYYEIDMRSFYKSTTKLQETNV